MEATKRADDENAVDRLRITMISAVIAPLIAHWLDTFLGHENNPWTGEKLMILFFSLISGRVILMVIEKGYRKSGLYAKGFNLYNAEVTETILWALPCAFVVTLYDTLFGATAVIVMFAIALFVMIKGKQLIVFNRKSYFEFRLYSLLAIILRIIHPVNFSPADGVKMFLITFNNQHPFLAAN